MPSKTIFNENMIDTKTFRIIHSDPFAALFPAILKDISQPALAVICQKNFTIKDSVINYRTINHWTNEKLFADDREDSAKGWRRFSLVDLLWLLTLSELRDFGLSLDKLRNAHSHLFFEDGKVRRSLEVAIGFCLARIPIFIAVYNNGYADIAMEPCLELTDIAHKYPPYIRLNVNAMLRELCPEDSKLDIAPEFLNMVPLSRSQKDLVQAITNHHNESVIAHLKQGKITGLTAKKTAKKSAKISEILDDVSFGEIKIKVENGKAVYTEITKHKKTKS